MAPGFPGRTFRNADDLELLADPEFQVVIAEALVSALLAYVNGR